MTDENLRKYIEEAKQSGISNEKVRNSLLASGWQESDINDALNQKGESFKIPKRFIYLIVAVIVLVGGYFVIAKYLDIWPFFRDIRNTIEIRGTNGVNESDDMDTVI